MSRKLSYSSVNTYNTCGKKYDLHYNQGYREKVQRSSLLFGSAFDAAANDLLLNRDLDKALAIFEKNWSFNFVHKVYTAMRSCSTIVYSDKDIDFDLLALTPVGEEWVKEFRERKKSLKWEEVPEDDRIAYNTYCWDSMLYKGKVMLTSYFEKVLPKFVKVEGVQEKSEITNSDGDTLVQYLDFVAHFEDGSVVLMDNKTTTSLDYYKDDSAGKSPQLLSYFFANQAKFNLQAVGYVAICKDIIKNKIKKCNVCGFDGSKSKARSCDQEYMTKVVKRGKEVEAMLRCDGVWDVKMGKLESAIKIIVNPVKQRSVDLAMEAFDAANHGIKAGVYTRNLSACDNQYGSPCPMKKLCWEGSDEDLAKKED